MILERYCYASDRTMGKLYVGGEEFFTIERPWIPSKEHRGGKNFESCIPDGTYSVQLFDSDNHHNVWSLMNPELDVFVYKPDLPGRWTILIHVGNHVKDVVGCIAVGLTGDESHVWQSGKAIDRLREIVTAQTEIVIRPKGAVNG